MKEYWIEVKGHPRYRVSTLGRVKCVDYRGTGKEKICKLNKGGSGYLLVYIDGFMKYVHRIVAESFIPNQEQKPEVEHINTNKVDNRIDNLKWVSHKENQNNPLTIKHIIENNAMLGKIGAEHHNSIPIVQLTKEEVFVKKWSCTMEVQRELGINQSNICSCCKGKRNSVGGYKWMYATDYNPVKHSISEIRPLF